MNIIKNLSKFFLVPDKTIHQWIQIAPYSYKEYNIKKRNGKKRKIA